MAGVQAAAATLLMALGLMGCAAGPRPLMDLNRQLAQGGESQEPAMGSGWLALIHGHNGRRQVSLIDLHAGGGRPVPLPGLNRPDAQPLAVAVDGRGERLAVVRQLEGHTELLLYRRGIQSLEPVPMEPAGVPRRLSLSADGHLLAVEVGRHGQWEVDLLELP